jgi:hypothetical protein
MNICNNDQNGTTGKQSELDGNRKHNQSKGVGGSLQSNSKNPEGKIFLLLSRYLICVVIGLLVCQFPEL